MSTREKLTFTEQIWAYIIGFGIALIIIAFVLIGLAIVDNNNITNNMLLVGIGFVLLGTGAWLYFEKPWEKFDDLQTPQFTGHHEAHAPTAEAEPESAPAAAPVEAEVESEPEPVPEPVAEVEPEPEPVPEPVAEAEPEPVPEPVAEVELEPEPVAEVATEPDDLTIIEGIGPKTAAALQSAGIVSFAQVATMTPEQLVETARANGARVSKADTWPQQAAKAAGGDVAALDDLQERIIDGAVFEDLTKIEGIGPKVQQLLHEAGYRTYQNVADANVEVLRTLLAENRLRMMSPDTWPQQAALLASGDLTALSELQEQLKGGRKS